MKLGAFSISLNVKDIAASKAFYAKLGFEPFGGDEAQGWLMLRNGETVLGLFGGFLEANALTFNPGWDQHAQNVEDFEDVRDIQKRLKADGVTFVSEADETTTGPASFVIMDPDGNPVLVDQHR
ncbi:VOC family protein [Yoonia sp. SS1-5]|uniref:VOC family protein n=1 Tax=Yoonia rhodophyticola TaxID=3137370 RepID=A0AAN0NIY0_9RHOB